MEIYLKRYQDEDYRLSIFPGDGRHGHTISSDHMSSGLVVINTDTGDVLFHTRNPADAVTRITELLEPMESDDLLMVQSIFATFLRGAYL